MEVKITRAEGADNDKGNTKPGGTGSGDQVAIPEERGGLEVTLAIHPMLSNRGCSRNLVLLPTMELSINSVLYSPRLMENMNTYLTRLLGTQQDGVLKFLAYIKYLVSTIFISN